MQFNDNQELISSMANYIKEQGTLNLTSEFFDCVVYISNSYYALKQINSIMITSTNAYDSAANYQLIICNLLLNHIIKKQIMYLLWIIIY